MTILHETLGDTIRAARIRQNYTQEHLAELLDITPAHLKHMESGRRKPSVPLLFQMMELLNFSVDALVFPQRLGAAVIHTDGLAEEEIEAVERLVDLLRKSKQRT